MPNLRANGVTIHYEQQGTGEPLILLPYLAADHACYAFQVADYARHFTCISLDLRGTGESDKPAGKQSVDLFADDVAAFMQAAGVERARVFGLSLGGAVAMSLAARYPERVAALSLHSTWSRTDPFIEAVARGWQALARGLGNVAETVVLGLFPWCFTPALYATKPDFIASLAGFVRSRPEQPVDAFLRQADAVIAHDAEPLLGSIHAPTQITFGRHDVVTSTRFASRLLEGIAGAEVTVFADSAHAPIYEQTAEFNARTLAFLQRG